MELHVGEVLEQDIEGLVRGALELLARQGTPMTPAEVFEAVAHDEADVLHPHLVDPLMNRRDQLDHRDHLAIENLERIDEKNEGDRPAVPKVLAVGTRVSLEQRPDVDVLIPFGNAEREMAQLI